MTSNDLANRMCPFQTKVGKTCLYQKLCSKSELSEWGCHQRDAEIVLDKIRVFIMIIMSLLSTSLSICSVSSSADPAYCGIPTGDFRAYFSCSPEHPVFL